MKKTIAFTLASGLLVATAAAKVSFSLDIEALTEGDGVTTISDTGLIVLVVDTEGDGFQLPNAGNLATGNDEVVAYWDLDAYSFSSADITLTTEGGVSWGENWSQGDDLALFWFPTLSTSNMSPAADTAYGVFSDALGLASGDGWAMPGNGTLLHSLKLFTAAATKLVPADYDELPASVGTTAFAVNTPPASGTPDVPSLNVANGGGKSTLTWTSASAPDGGYIVQRKLANGDWETIGVAASGDTSFDDPNVLPGRTYEYRLYSVGVFAASTNSPIPAIVSERSKFVNLAARGHIVPDSENRDWTLLNAGIVMAGNDPLKRILALGIGPYNRDRLNQEWISDTRMEYELVSFPGGALSVETIATNVDWMRDSDHPTDPSSANPDANTLDIAMQTRGTPLLPTESASGANAGKDSAIIEDIVNISESGSSNIFKVFANDDTLDPGFAGIQVYDAEFEGGDNPTIHDNRIVNLSTKGYLASNGVFNASMVIDGNVNKEVLVLARGPALAVKNVESPLPNPKLILKRGAVVVAENDDWDNPTAAADPDNGLIAVETDIDRIRAAITAAGQNPDEHTLDSAMLVTLEPGSTGYIFKVEAADGSTVTDGTVQVQVNEIEF